MPKPPEGWCNPANTDPVTDKQQLHKSLQERNQEMLEFFASCTKRFGKARGLRYRENVKG